MAKRRAGGGYRLAGLLSLLVTAVAILARTQAVPRMMLRMKEH
jgi:hypothetical protein